MMQDYNATYLFRVLNALSQLGNAIAGGSPDIAISGRIGYMVHFDPSNFWIISESLVNWAFRPVDGESHCYKAYKSDPREDFMIGKGSKFGIVIMAILVVLLTPVLRVINWTISRL